MLDEIRLEVEERGGGVDTGVGRESISSMSSLVLCAKVPRIEYAGSFLFNVHLALLSFLPSFHLLFMSVTIFIP
jgi:hypothetical protein